MSTAARRQRLVSALDERGLDAMLVTDLTNVRYLTGYVGSNAIAMIGNGIGTLFTDSRYAVSAREQAAGCEVVIGRRDLLGDVATALSDLPGGARVGVESEHLTLARHRRMTEALEGVDLEPVAGLVEDLRIVKDADEIAAIARAAEVADRALAKVLATDIVGRTERDVAWDLEGAIRGAGGERSSFDIIVAGGPRGARPHAVPGPEPIPADSLVVIDLGAVVDGYCSDMTRMVATGDLVPELERAWRVCHRAQAVAVEAVRPGMRGDELDAVARDLISDEGFGDAFGHGLGHGVGLDIHERPGVRQEGRDQLESGMVITVEPGIYLEGIGGVRVEDLLVVRDSGPEVLSRHVKQEPPA